MDLIRTPHFKEYVKERIAFCWMSKRGLTKNEALDKFKDTFYEDFNMLSYVLAGTYPHTRRVDNSYEFITDEVIHENIVSHEKGNVGRVILTIRDHIGIIKFEEKSFQHSSISDRGEIHCYGSYLPFCDNVIKIGFAGALMDLYNFARVSYHQPTWGNSRRIYA